MGREVDLNEGTPPYDLKGNLLLSRLRLVLPSSVLSFPSMSAVGAQHTRKREAESMKTDPETRPRSNNGPLLMFRSVFVACTLARVSRPKSHLIHAPGAHEPEPTLDALDIQVWFRRRGIHEKTDDPFHGLSRSVVVTVASRLPPHYHSMLAVWAQHTDDRELPRPNIP